MKHGNDILGGGSGSAPSQTLSQNCVSVRKPTKMADEERTTLLGIRTISDACKVSASTVYNWLRTYPDMPQPKYEITGPLGEDGKRKKTPAWGPEQLVHILDWHKNGKG